MTSIPYAIEARGLRKEYGPKIAVRSLDLAIEPGQVYGFLGPNGAGKTTSVKMLLGLVHPTAGESRLLGVPSGSPQARKRVGFLPEHFRFHEWLAADEFLRYHGRLHCMSRADAGRRADELLERVGLHDARTRRLSTFSKGMLQRIGLAQALLHDPDIVFLDEPTSGLDPLGRRMVRDVIHDLAHRNKTVFLNSHLLSEIEVTCTRVAFVTDGVVRHETDLGEGHRDGLLFVTLRVDRVDEPLLQGLRRWSTQVEPSPDEAHTVTLRLDSESALPEIARWLVDRGNALYTLAPRTLSLEDLFVSIVESNTP